jgi:anti-anti-sigma factor
MLVSSRKIGDRLLLTPHQPLLAGGAAEAFESQLRQMIRSGQRHIIVDLGTVSAIDSAGVRALVRGHTSIQRAGGSMRLAAIKPNVQKVLDLSHLASIFETYATVESAAMASIPWDTILTAVAGTTLCALLFWLGITYPYALAGVPAPGASFPPGGESAPPITPSATHAFIELGKLIAALAIGVLVSMVHRPNTQQRGMGRSMAQAQTLLCVSGAMMMIIIGNSLARAFGIAGAASIIRFRTPVDDPKDVTILFLLMGLGMSTGLGSFAVAGLGTAFLCAALFVLDHVTRQQARVMAVEIVAEGKHFPTTHVENVFLRNQVPFEPREITHDDDVTIKYHTWIDPQVSLEELSAQLMDGKSGVSAVSWDQPKRA